MMRLVLWGTETREGGSLCPERFILWGYRVRRLRTELSGRAGWVLGPWGGSACDKALGGLETQRAGCVGDIMIPPTKNPSLS